jgi:ACS family hexuronate transporter-like MFS transporter
LEIQANCERSRARQSHRRRWCVCGLVFAATVVSYIDRQTLSVTSPVIAGEFKLDNQQLAGILSAFLITYTFGQPLAGCFFDWVGNRVAFSVAIAVWSLANVLTALVTRPWEFGLFRFLLGIGESGNFPGGVKVISEWFPARERPLAVGIFSSGGSVGAVLAGPLVGTVTHYWGWRPAFVVTGSLGFFWLTVWLMLYPRPERHLSLNFEERPLAAMDERNDAGIRWIELFRFRQVWALLLSRVLEEPLIWMAVFWLPKYIVDVRGLSLIQASWLLPLPFIALDIGYVGGGWASGKLMMRGWTAYRAKVVIMSAATVLMVCAIPAVFSNNVVAFTIFLSLATLGHGSWASNMITMPSDVASHRIVASVYGISGMGGGLAGIWFTAFTGIIADKFHTFTPAFIVAGLLPIAGLAVLVLLGGTMDPLRGPRSTLKINETL